jgi:hypothetical protein
LGGHGANRNNNSIVKRLYHKKHDNTESDGEVESPTNLLPILKVGRNPRKNEKSAEAHSFGNSSKLISSPRQPWAEAACRKYCIVRQFSASLLISERINFISKSQVKANSIQGSR